MLYLSHKKEIKIILSSDKTQILSPVYAKKIVVFQIDKNMALILPKQYKLKLLPETTEQAIKTLKVNFQEKLSKALNLRRVTAPLFVLTGTGINDDLNGSERAVSFPIKCMNDRKADVVHSLAKWKRVKLGF